MSRSSLGLRLALIAGVAAAAAVAFSVSARPALASAGTFSPGSEGTFVVPTDGVIQVTVIGGTGGNNGCGPDGWGGYGSKITATIPVKAGTLYIDVGGNGGSDGTGGSSGTSTSGGSGGTNQCAAGGGGGASVISTCSANDVSCLDNYFTQNEPRLIVAGGGGGAGGYDGCSGGNGGGGVPTLKCRTGGGGGGGNGTGGTGQGADPQPTPNDFGGAGATQQGAGAGGLGDDNGSAGSGTAGGNGSTIYGGGGGGGYYGGGGGSSDLNDGEYGAGGGAGSSWVTGSANNVSYSNDRTATPSVTISFHATTLNCNSEYLGTYAAVTVQSGATCYLDSGTAVTGGIQVKPGGTLYAYDVNVGGSVTSNGYAAVCGSTISKNVQAGGAGLELGGECGGNTIDGNLTVQNSSGDIYVYGNEVSGVHVFNNTGEVRLVGNTVAKTLSVENNTNEAWIGFNDVYDLSVVHNSPLTDVSSNSATHNAICSRNQGLQDSGGGNTAGNRNTCPVGGP